MAKTIGEVRNFLDSLIGKTTVDKSDSSLNGQCVSLVKNLLEFLGAPNPYSARGNAKDIPNTYISQGIAKKGSGSLNIAVNRYDGGGYGHVWVKIGSDSWQANYAGFPVKKNVGEVAITDILNLDQWISTSNTSGNANETTKRKGETTMQCFFKPDNENTVYYFDGKGITPIINSDEMNILNAIYKENNGKEMPYIKRTGAWFTRLKDASKRSILK